MSVTYVAHATLQALGLAVRRALAAPAFSALLAIGPVRHRGTSRTLRLRARALRFLLASRVLRFAALGAFRQELATLAARRVLVAARTSAIKLPSARKLSFAVSNNISTCIKYGTATLMPIFIFGKSKKAQVLENRLRN